MQSGIAIGTGKTVTLKDVDVKDINNTNLPANAVIDVENNAILKINGSSTVNKE
jgi:hypothetical protein